MAIFLYKLSCVDYCMEMFVTFLSRRDLALGIDLETVAKYYCCSECCLLFFALVFKAFLYLGILVCLCLINSCLV